MNNKDEFYERVADYHQCDDSYLKPVLIPKELASCFEEINEKLKEIKKYIMPNDYDDERSKRKLKDAADFLKHNFRLSRIYTLDEEEEKELYGKTSEYKNNLIGNTKRILAYYGSVNSITPYELPIYLTQDKNISGSTRLIFPYSIKAINQFLEPYFGFIYINSSNSNYVGSTYVHEITHTQVEKRNTTYTNLLNREMLSTFMELFYVYNAYSPKILMSNVYLDYANLLHFKDEIKDNETYHKIYFYSTLMAIELFLIYINSNENEKAVIQSEVQKIFNGTLSIEDLLESHNIDINNIDCDRMVRTLSK